MATGKRNHQVPTPSHSLRPVDQHGGFMERGRGCVIKGIGRSTSAGSMDVNNVPISAGGSSDSGEPTSTLQRTTQAILIYTVLITKFVI